MRDFLRRWGLRALWIPVLALVLCGVVQLADYVWFRTQVPIGYRPNWEGTWESVPLGRFEGRLLVAIPDPLPVNEDFKAEALVYYPIYFGYRTGKFTKFDFTGRFSPDESATSGATPKVAGRPLGALENIGGGKVKFKGEFEGQQVEYSALLSPTRGRMVGGYLSESPRDNGLFTIRQTY